MPVLWLAVWRATKLRAARRAGYFAAVAPLLTQVRSRAEPSGFPRLAGHYGGHAFDLQAVPDTLTYRKLPTLWLMVTLTEAQPVTGEAHILARPGQNDTFSRFGQMTASVALPPGFPEHCALRCDDATLLPPQALVASLAPIFADPSVKELVLSPKALRLVVLADEAERGAYLLFRDAEMGLRPLAPSLLLPHLATLLTLSRTLRTQTDADA